jgi:hypothetical protein
MLVKGYSRKKTETTSLDALIKMVYPGVFENTG